MSPLTNVTVSLTVDPCTLSAPGGMFVANTDGAVSMLAEHGTIESARDSNWTDTSIETIPGYGLIGSAVTVLPPTAGSIDRPPGSTTNDSTVGKGPSLAFDFFLPPSTPTTSSSNMTSFNVTTWLAPILNYRDKRPLRYVLELDSDPASRTVVTPVPENITPGTNSADWGNVVSANIRKVTTTVQTASSGKVGGKHTVNGGHWSLGLCWRRWLWSRKVA